MERQAREQGKQKETRKVNYAGSKNERVNESLPVRAEESSAGAVRPLAIEFDYEEFAHFLASYDLTEEEKRAHLEALWQLLLQWVALGFNVHPAQQSCGKNALKSTLAGLFAVQCENGKQHVEYAGAPDDGAAAEESEE